MISKLPAAALAVVVLLVGASAVAADAPAEEPEEEVRFVDEEIWIQDMLLTVSDTTVSGPGLGEHHVEDRTYAVDSTVRIDGLHVTHDGTRYTICRVVVHVEDVGVRLTDVRLTEGN